MFVTIEPAWISTPVLASSFVARPERSSPNEARISLPPSNSSTLTSVAGSKRRKLFFSARRASSAIWPVISTPVGPPPTATNVSHAFRFSGSSSSSASSSAPKIRARWATASASVFIPGANSSYSSCPKYDWPPPAATIRLS